MTNSGILKHRLTALFVIMVIFAAVNTFKLAVAFAWTNHWPLGPIAAVCLGLFLVGSIIALSFNLDEELRQRLTFMVGLLFIVQTALICIVSFIYSLSLMPAAEIALLFNTPVELTRRVLAIAEGATLSISEFAYWGALASIWHKEIEARRTNLGQLVELDAARQREEVS